MTISRNSHNSLKDAAMQVVVSHSPQPEPLNEEITEVQNIEGGSLSLAEQYLSDILDGSLNESLNEEDTAIYVNEAIDYIFNLAFQLDEMLKKTK
jgi:hypothetical protein